MNYKDTLQPIKDSALIQKSFHTVEHRIDSTMYDSITSHTKPDLDNRISYELVQKLTQKLVDTIDVDHIQATQFEPHKFRLECIVMDKSTMLETLQAYLNTLPREQLQQMLMFSISNLNNQI